MVWGEKPNSIWLFFVPLSALLIKFHILVLLTTMHPCVFLLLWQVCTMASKPPAPLMKKHSQTDLISRLKSRKILGVGGEDDDGEVHRSKVRLLYMDVFQSVWINISSKIHSNGLCISAANNLALNMSAFVKTRQLNKYYSSAEAKMALHHKCIC